MFYIPNIFQYKYNVSVYKIWWVKMFLLLINGYIFLNGMQTKSN